MSAYYYYSHPFLTSQWKNAANLKQRLSQSQNGHEHKHSCPQIGLNSNLNYHPRFTSFGLFQVSETWKKVVLKCSICGPFRFFDSKLGNYKSYLLDFWSNLNLFFGVNTSKYDHKCSSEAKKRKKRVEKTEKNVHHWEDLNPGQWIWSLKLYHWANSARFFWAKNQRISTNYRFVY